MNDRRVKTTERELLEVMATHPYPVMTSTEIAAKVEIGQQAVYKRLQSFEKQGYVLPKSVGANATVWWLTPTGRERLDELG